MKYKVKEPILENIKSQKTFLKENEGWTSYYNELIGLYNKYCEDIKNRNSEKLKKYESHCSLLKDLEKNKVDISTLKFLPQIFLSNIYGFQQTNLSIFLNSLEEFPFYNIDKLDIFTQTNFEYINKSTQVEIMQVDKFIQTNFDEPQEILQIPFIGEGNWLP